MYDLNRFHSAQAYSYEAALSEIRGSKKRSHWMWFIFPQMRGLGTSSTAYRYGIEDLEEAKAYLADPVLGKRLVEISQALLDQPVSNAYAIFGGTDTRKLRSCMTLFEQATQDQTVFTKVLERFFGGSRDAQTLEMLNK